MIKKIIMLSVMALVTYPITVSATAEGFKADISVMEATKQFKVLNIGSLAVGEKGLVSEYGLYTCIEDGIVKVSSLSKLDTAPNKYGVDYEVSRESNNSLDIKFSQKGKKADVSNVEYQVTSIIDSEDCKKLKEKGIPLFEIKTLFGSKSLKELVSRSTNIVKKTVSSSESKADTTISSWIVSNDKSPIDDSPSVTMMKLAEDGGSQTLILRCKENTTEAYISTSDFMGIMGSGTNKMLVRFDDKKAVKQSIGMSTDGKALFFKTTIKNIKKMMEAKKMVIRYYPYGGGAKTATFNLGNLKEEVAPLRDACHW